MEKREDKLSPMMEQYFRIRERFAHCLVAFRLGDFYEFFYEDAHIVSAALDLTLTRRDAGGGKHAPMCGIPHHAVDSYVSKLVAKGHKVAICEQTEDPKSAAGKIVKREVTQVLTKGTILDAQMLERGENNYLAALYRGKNFWGISVADISTGEFYAYSRDIRTCRIADETALFNPREIIADKGLEPDDDCGVTPEIDSSLFDYGDCYVKLCNQFKTLNLSGFGFYDGGGDESAIRAAGALLIYAEKTRMCDLTHITSLKRFDDGRFLVIDRCSRKNLELTTALNGSAKGTLFSVINYTKTASGERLLRRWTESPLVSVREIRTRLNAVEKAKDNADFRADAQKTLGLMSDAERITARAACGKANPKDIAALKKTLSVLPHLKELLRGVSRNDAPSALFAFFGEMLDVLPDIYGYLNDAVDDDGVIRDAVNPDLAKYRDAMKNGAGWLVDYETKEREKSGIKGLKVRYTRVFGYYIEISNANKLPVPGHYVRRQTLVNCERYATEELKKIEEVVLNAEEQAKAAENAIFAAITAYVAKNAGRIAETAAAVSSVDAIVALAEAAERNGYVKPEITETLDLDIQGGRHQVVELFCDERFVPNDCLLDGGKNRLAVITGPNMAGKSTFMRQVALICIMAQMGGFVPAERASIGIVDKIFTRVGASDDLATGRSTFMVEMTETANIVRNATERSLLILDEIGRGTSTFDGLAIAWAVLEHIARDIKARTLFATHYRELTALEGTVGGVINLRAAAKQKGKNIVFLRKIERGSASGSYGVQVARLAGLPDSVTNRAERILNDLNEASIVKQGDLPERAVVYGYTDGDRDGGGGEISPGVFLVKDVLE